MSWDFAYDPAFEKSAKRIFGNAYAADERMKAIEWALFRSPDLQGFPVILKSPSGREIRYYKTDAASWAPAVVVVFSADKRHKITFHDIIPATTHAGICI